MHRCLFCSFMLTLLVSAELSISLLPTPATTAVVTDVFTVTTPPASNEASPTDVLSSPTLMQSFPIITTPAPTSSPFLSINYEPPDSAAPVTGVPPSSNGAASTGIMQVTSQNATMVPPPADQQNATGTPIATSGPPSQQSSVVIVTLGTSVFSSTPLIDSPIDSTSTAAADAGRQAESNVRAWAIAAGVIGGAALASAIAYVLWKCSRQRGDLSDPVDFDTDIKWRVLHLPKDDSHLPPCPVRKTGGSGIGEEGSDSFRVHSPNRSLSADVGRHSRQSSIFTLSTPSPNINPYESYFAEVCHQEIRKPQLDYPSAPHQTEPRNQCHTSASLLSPSPISELPQIPMCASFAEAPPALLHGTVHTEDESSLQVDEPVGLGRGMSARSVQSLAGRGRRLTVANPDS